MGGAKDSMNAWAVTWRRKPLALPFIIDVDDAEMAAEIAIRLHSIPQVYDVRVTGMPESQMDDEARERVRARIAERIDHEWAFGVMAG